MAEDSLRQVAQFPEVSGKTINTVEVSSVQGHFGITLSFTDETMLAFTIESGVVTFPALSVWSKGEETLIKQYPPVSSKIP